jgi:hypothetical protein
MKILNDRGHFVRLGAEKCGTAFEEEFNLSERGISSPAFVNTRSWIKMSFNFSSGFGCVTSLNLVRVRNRRTKFPDLLAATKLPCGSNICFPNDPITQLRFGELGRLVF